MLKKKKVATSPSFHSISKNEIKECDTEDEGESDESGDEEDGPLNELEIEELCERYKLLYYDLINKGHRKNVSELLDILVVLREEGLISQVDYMEVRNKVKDYEEIKECHTADDDDPLTESEQKELCKRFKSLHYDLIHKGLRKNATELLDILDILLEADLISEADRMKTANKINEDYLTTF